MRHFATLALCALVAAAVPAAADPPAFPDFEARRVKPPKPGTKKRILVQITAPAPRKLAPAKVAPATGDSGDSGAPTHGWFWTTVSAKYEARNPGRLEEALAALDKAPAGQGVRAPRLKDLQKIAAVQGVEILKATVGTQVSPALALAVMSVESGGRVDAVSSAGAQGLMQLMPATAARFGVDDTGVAAENIKGGVRFLDFLIRKFEGDPILVLAGYNAGENSIGKHDGVPPYAETRDYVPKVLAAWKVAQGLCKTPPMFISDGCVFVTMN
ncbi:lytic transglycosylase domain-containing protein [Marinovum sp.]|uniref:lytic transglycosylase domain-containing protein n=1 Tax=Marinovum sp. TaxID=2024839 RepID=UPI003A956057